MAILTLGGTTVFHCLMHVVCQPWHLRVTSVGASATIVEKPAGQQLRSFAVPNVPKNAYLMGLISLLACLMLGNQLLFLQGFLLCTYGTVRCARWDGKQSCLLLLYCLTSTRLQEVAVHWSSGKKG